MGLRLSRRPSKGQYSAHTRVLAGRGDRENARLFLLCGAGVQMGPGHGVAGHGCWDGQIKEAWHPGDER